MYLPIRGVPWGGHLVDDLRNEEHQGEQGDDSADGVPDHRAEPEAGQGEHGQLEPGGDHPLGVAAHDVPFTIETKSS